MKLVNKATPVKITVGRRVDVAPGVANYELVVTAGSNVIRKPKVDKKFAELFVKRLRRNSEKIPGYAGTLENV
jgi:hypothetical protein